MRHLAAAVLVSLSFASCGDIEVKSIRVVEAVPSNLQGQWTGQWASTHSSGSGTVTLRMQDFGGEPVVSIQLDNPCIEPRSYQFRTTGNLIELLADGMPLFSAVLGDERTLAGTYECAADTGVWTVSWARELAPLVDLGGLWLGSVTVPGLAPQALRLDLDFMVEGGALVVHGAARLPELSSMALPITGVVFFGDSTLLPTFQFVLLVPTGDGDIGLQLSGTGNVEDERIDVGAVQTNDPSLPFSSAIWQAQRIAP